MTSFITAHVSTDSFVSCVCPAWFSKQASLVKLGWFLVFSATCKVELLNHLCKPCLIPLTLITGWLLSPCYPKEPANCPPMVYLCIVLWEPRERWEISPTSPETNARQALERVNTCMLWLHLVSRRALLSLFCFLFLWKGWRLHNYRCCCLKLRMFSKPPKGHASSNPGAVLLPSSLL